MLSTRIIYFGTTETFWECQSNNQRECTSDSTNIARPLSRNYPLTPEDVKRALLYIGNDHFSTSGGLTLWYNTVYHYSKKKLTRASDILPAISGIASRIQRHTSHTYMYGLWWEDLNRGLLWYNESDKETKMTGVPSWSWAAITAEVRFTNWRSSQAPHTTPLQFQGTSSDGRELLLRDRCR